MARINKGIRLTEEELERVQLLLQHHPDYDSESDLLVAATRRGLMLLAAEAVRPGLPRYAGYAGADLAVLLKQRLTAALELLIAEGLLPLMHSPPLAAPAVAAPEIDAPPPAPAAAEPALEDIIIDHEAAAELEGFGSGFLD